jgi:hypothetical protein
MDHILNVKEIFCVKLFFALEFLSMQRDPSEGWMVKWLNGRMVKWLNGWMVEWLDGLMVQVFMR